MPKNKQYYLVLNENNAKYVIENKKIPDNIKIYQDFNGFNPSTHYIIGFEAKKRGITVETLANTLMNLITIFTTDHDNNYDAPRVIENMGKYVAEDKLNVSKVKSIKPEHDINYLSPKMQELIVQMKNSDRIESLNPFYLKTLQNQSRLQPEQEQNETSTTQQKTSIEGQTLNTR